MGAAGQTSIIAWYRPDLSLLLTSVDPESGKTRAEISLQTDSCCNFASGAWTATNDTIFIAQGDDLILYDMKTGRTRAYIKDLIAPAGNGRSGSTFRPIIDPQYHRLIAVTEDGKHSRIVPLDSLEKAGEDWRATDATLARD